MGRIRDIYTKNQQGKWNQCEKVFVEVQEQQKRQLSFMTSVGAELLHTDGPKGFCHHKFQANFIIEGHTVEVLVNEAYYELGESVIKVTERGKKCHPNCPLIKKSSQCRIKDHIFFAKVIQSAWIQIGDALSIKQESRCV